MGDIGEDIAAIGSGIPIIGANPDIGVGENENAGNAGTAGDIGSKADALGAAPAFGAAEGEGGKKSVAGGHVGMADDVDVIDDDSASIGAALELVGNSAWGFNELVAVGAGNIGGRYGELGALAAFGTEPNAGGTEAAEGIGSSKPGGYMFVRSSAVFAA